MIRWSTHLRSHFWTISSTSFEDAMNNRMDIFCRDQGFMITTFQNPFYNKLLLYIVRFFTMVQINCEHLATKTKSFAGILGYGSLTPFRAIVTWTDSDDLRPRWLLHTSNDAPYLFLCFPRLATFLKTWRHCELNLFMITSCSSTFRVITRNSFFLFFFFTLPITIWTANTPRWLISTHRGLTNNACFSTKAFGSGLWPRFDPRSTRWTIPCACNVEKKTLHFLEPHRELEPKYFLITRVSRHSG